MSNCLPTRIGSYACNAGYGFNTQDVKNWSCGSNCIGGKNLTDGNCGCACVKQPASCNIKKTLKPITTTPNPKCLPNSVGSNRFRCYPGYGFNTTDIKYWDCGFNCEGGGNLVDSNCKCACSKQPPGCT